MSDNSIDVGLALDVDNDDDKGSTLPVESSSSQKILSTIVSPEKFDSTKKMKAPPSAKHYRYVDETSKTTGRRLELEELRSKHLAKNLRIEFAQAAQDDSVPLATSDLTSFFLQQTELGKELRKKKLDSADYLHQYRNNNIKPGVSNRSPKSVVQSAPIYATMTEMELFFRQQREIDQEWRQHQRNSLDYLHGYRREVSLSPSRISESGSRHKNFPLRAPSGYGDDTITNLYASFLDMRRSLEARFVSAVQCPLPDSPSIGPVGVLKVSDFTSGANRDNELLLPILPDVKEPQDAVDDGLQSDETDVIDTNDDTIVPKENDMGKAIVVLESEESACDELRKIDHLVEVTRSRQGETLVEVEDIESMAAILDLNDQLEFGALQGEGTTGTKGQASLEVDMSNAVKGSAPVLSKAGQLRSTALSPRRNTRNPLSSTLRAPKTSAQPPAHRSSTTNVSAISSSRTRKRDPTRLKSAIASVSRPWRQKPTTPLHINSTRQLIEGHCDQKWKPNIHVTRGGCELCLALATEEERRKFDIEGHHYRVNDVRGGCTRSCRQFPRMEGDEPPVRLCRTCFYITHKLGG